jgi:predicted DCC family thiol-disulfide oxidoreductase YuxK
MFIIRRDSRARIRFAQLKSPSGLSILNDTDLDSDSVDSVVYIKEGKYFLKSSAVLHLLKDIGNGWQLFYAFIVIPGFIRDFFYNSIARSRYRIFGMRSNCFVPSAEYKERFLN